MAYTRPTLESIIDRIKGDIRDVIGIVSVIRRSFYEALAIALGGAIHILHGHARFVSKQIFPDQAEVEYLERWGAVYGIQRNAATFGNYQISGTGVDGTNVPAGTVLLRSDGVEYTVDASALVAGGVVSVAVTASVAGANSNIDVGEGLSLQSPITNIDADFTVTAVNTEAEDIEKDDSYRARILARIRTPPSGGTVNDYLTYTLEVPGVTRAWILLNWEAAGFLGEGGLGIAFVEDGEDPIIPSPAKVAEVQANVDVQKPVTADAVVFAPDPLSVDITIALSPNTAEVQASVTAELEALFAREANVSGAINPEFIASKTLYTGIISLSKINEAISVADGEQDHAIDLTNDVNPSDGQIAVLGTLTFTPLA